MDIVVYRSGKPWADPIERAMVAGFSRHGVDVEERPSGDWRVSDIAVVWGHRDDDLHRMQRAAGKDYLVMERGYLGDIQMRRKWTSLGFNGLNGNATFPKCQDAGERWDNNFGHMVKPWRSGEYAVVMGQVFGDASLVGVDIRAWVENAVTAAKCAFGFPVVYRPHPVSLERGDHWIPDDCEVSYLPLSEDLDRAAVVVTFNSNSAVDAVLSGVPAVSFDRGSMAWPVTAHEYQRIQPDRAAWCDRLAWRQWELNEIETGEAWEALKSCL